MLPAGEYERNKTLAHICAAILVAGLASELVISWHWFEGWKTAFEMGATTLVVLGVAGEVWFAHKATIVGDKQIEEYRARAAEAELKTEQLRRTLAWRRLETNAVLDTLQEAAGTVVQLVYAASDPEAASFSIKLSHVLQDAGWNVSGLSSAPYQLFFSGWILPSGASVSSIGLTILARSLEEGDRKPGSALQLLENALLNQLGSVDVVHSHHAPEGGFLIAIAPRI